MSKKQHFVIGYGLSQWWLLPKVDIGRVLVQKKMIVMNMK